MVRFTNREVVLTSFSAFIGAIASSVINSIFSQNHIDLTTFSGFVGALFLLGFAFFIIVVFTGAWAAGLYYFTRAPRKRLKSKV